MPGFSYYVSPPFPASTCCLVPKLAFQMCFLQQHLPQVPKSMCIFYWTSSLKPQWLKQHIFLAWGPEVWRVHLQAAVHGFSGPCFLASPGEGRSSLWGAAGVLIYVPLSRATLLQPLLSSGQPPFWVDGPISLFIRSLWALDGASRRSCAWPSMVEDWS